MGTNEGVYLSEGAAVARSGDPLDFFNLGPNPVSSILSGQTTPTTFTLFPKLPPPPEIRRAIWKEACYGRRLVDIQPTVLRELETASGYARMQITPSPEDYRLGITKFEYKTMS
jgi:hypothetical protein